MQEFLDHLSRRCTKANEAKQGAEKSDSLEEVLRGQCVKYEKVKSKLPWISNGVGDVKTMGYLPKKAAGDEWLQERVHMCCWRNTERLGSQSLFELR